MADPLQFHIDFLHNLPDDFRGEVRTDPYSRLLYSTDASIYQIEPLAVVLPRTNDDVQMVVAACARERVPVLARGAGSALAGQTVGRAVVLDFSRYLNKVLEINPEEHWARVQPGLVCDHLNAHLQPYGLQYGTDPASANRATIGGIVANNSTGAHSMMYGMTADHVLETDVILSDGSQAHFASIAPDAPMPSSDSFSGTLHQQVADIVQRNSAGIRTSYPRTWRNSSGYRLNYLLSDGGYVATRPSGWTGEHYPAVDGFNMAQLMAGSEGTLAVLTEIKVNLVPRPKQTVLGILQFDSIAAACDATPAILETEPSAVELMDEMIVRLTRGVPAYNRMLTFVEGIPAAVLIVEYYGESEAELLAKLERLDARIRQLDASQQPTRSTRAVTAAEQARVWGVRKVGLGLMMSVKGDAKPIPFIEDAAVPVEQLGDYVRAVEQVFNAHDVTAGYYAHASAGCLHIRPLINTKSNDQIETMYAVAKSVLEIIAKMGGAMTGEHGDGLARSAFNRPLFGEAVYQAFCDVKQAFDPHGILNPGKVVDAQDMRENLRFGEHYETVRLETQLDFSADGGFARAVEMCNGAGVCRKADGVMCPSYQATREEEHSTRGRANALRAALSGRLPSQALTEKRMYQVLDLCLECKACKAECPSGVDMAKIKAEFLAQYYARHGVPLRARFFANINTLSRLASPFSGLVNFALALPITRWLNEKFIGVARQRRLPRFAQQTFRRIASRQINRRVISNPQSSDTSLNPVVLFVDTFTEYNHPEVGVAALQVLTAAGFDVEIVEQQGCCGRPLISKGLLAQARTQARKNIAALAHYAQRGIPIVGLEPACLLTLRDEYLSLHPNDSAAQAVAEQSVMIEEFLATHVENIDLKAAWKADRRKVLVHGHCYQKALVGTEPLLAMLRLPGWEVEEIESGCCGMAGSWGYEAEHYVVSRNVGEDRLFPAVRSAGAETYIAAAGTSCRDQISHFTDRQAVHPIVLLADALN